MTCPRWFWIIPALTAASSPLAAQNVTSADLIARIQEYQEDNRMLKSDVAALTERQEALDRRISSELTRIRQEIVSLKESVARMNATGVSREQLERIVEQVREVDKRRQDDAKFVAKQLEELARLSSNPPPSAPAPAISEDR